MERSIIKESDFPFLFCQNGKVYYRRIYYGRICYRPFSPAFPFLAKWKNLFAKNLPPIFFFQFSFSALFPPLFLFCFYSSFTKMKQSITENSFSTFAFPPFMSSQKGRIYYRFSFMTFSFPPFLLCPCSLTKE